MATGDTLTKYKDSVTIITADTANSWYGGLYGSSEGALLSSDDPRNIGHVHDGQHIDGHAGKIDLVEHVGNQLRNKNIATDAITSRNIRGFANQSNAIPESEVIDTVRYYYLDLSDLRTTVSEASGFVLDSGVVRENVNGDGDYSSDDFVFGSSQLNDTGNALQDSRMLFDKSASAFRVGTAEGTEWNNRGTYSFATGLNNTCSASASVALGGGENSITGSGVGGFCVSGAQSTLTNTTRSGVIGSDNATINGSITSSLIMASTECRVTADYAVARGGFALSDTDYKFSHGAGQLGSRGPGSAQGADYVGRGRTTSSDRVNILANGSSFVIPDNTVYNLDIDIVLITQASGGGAVGYCGGKAHALVKTNAAGGVTITNTGAVYGFLSGATVSVQSAGNNQWNIRVVLAGTRDYIEAVAYIKSTEIIANSGDLNSATAFGAT